MALRVYRMAMRAAAVLVSCTSVAGMTGCMLTACNCSDR